MVRGIFHFNTSLRWGSAALGLMFTCVLMIRNTLSCCIGGENVVSLRHVCCPRCWRLWWQYKQEPLPGGVLQGRYKATAFVGCANVSSD